MMTNDDSATGRIPGCIALLMFGPYPRPLPFCCSRSRRLLPIANKHVVLLLLLSSLLSVVHPDEAVATVEEAGSGGRDGVIAALEGMCYTPSGGRAALALSRMHRRGAHDAAVHCWLAGVLAGAKDTDGAAAECKRAYSLAPAEPCSLYCSVHFLLWGGEWTALQGLVPVAAAAALRELSEGLVPSLAYLEALLLLPPPALHQLFAGRAAFLLSPWPSLAPLQPFPLSFSLGDRDPFSLAIKVIFMCAFPRDHPHGRALLDALTGLAGHRLTVRGGRVDVACIFTGGDSDGDGQGDGTRRDLENACGRWRISPAARPAALAAAVNEERAHVAVDLDVWAEGGHVAALLLRPAELSVVMIGHVGSAGVKGAHDYVLTVRGMPSASFARIFCPVVTRTCTQDRVCSPPEVRGDYTERIMATPIHRTYFVSAPFSPPPPALPRGELGLPAKGVVISSLNPAFKLTPSLLQVWARLLLTSPSATLWIPSYPPRARLPPPTPSASLLPPFPFLTFSSAPRRSVISELVKRGAPHGVELRVITTRGGSFSDEAHIAAKAAADIALDPHWVGGVLPHTPSLIDLSGL